MDTPHTRCSFPFAGMRHLLALAFTALFALPLHAEETEAIRPEPEHEQSDIYYNAMLRSIELDRNRWKSFSRSVESGPWFYDTQGLKRDGNRISVPVTAYPHPNRTDLYRSVYPDHTKIRKIEFVTEIDCSKQTYRQPLIRVYGYYKELLSEHAHDTIKQPFSPIRPGTTTDTLRTLVCSPEKRKKR